MPYTCTLYAGTGFNSLDIPDSPDLLESAYKTKTELPAIISRQTLYKAQIKVSAIWSAVRDTDYVKLAGTYEVAGYTLDDIAYYTVDSIEMTSQNTAVLNVSLDALTTLGGPASTYIGFDGWVTRYHVENDALFLHTCDEPIATTRDWVVETGEGVPPGSFGTAKQQLVGLTINPTAEIYTSAESVANPSYDSTTTGGQYQPRYISEYKRTYQAPPVTSFYMADTLRGSGFGGQGMCPGVGFYRIFDSGVIAGINRLRALGMESAILYSYTIPEGACRLYYWSDSVSIDEIDGVYHEHTETLRFKPILGYTPRNNKVYSGQFNKFTLIAPSSGAQQEYRAEEIYDSTTPDNPVFIAFTDPSPNGGVYYRPKFFHGNQTAWLMGAVAGARWEAAPVAYTTRSGAEVDIANNSISQSVADARVSLEYNKQLDLSHLTFMRGLVGSTVAGVVNPVVGAAGLAKTLIGAESRYTNLQLESDYAQAGRSLEKQEAAARLSLAASTTPPEIAFPVAASMQQYTTNAAVVYQKHISLMDMVRIDEFFDLYGYAESCAMKRDVFFTRQCFNYVQGECEVLPNHSALAPGAPSAVRSMCKAASEQLRNGVRVWHVRPLSDYLHNGQNTPV